MRLVPALIGAVLAAVVWLFTGRLFADVVVKTGNYTAIYSAFAGLILFMLWLHLAWLILLLGASVSYALQNPQRVGHRLEGCGRLNAETVLRLGALIVEDFARAGPGWTAPALASRLNMREEEILPLLERLHAANILTPDTRQPPAWRPAAAPEVIPLESVIEVIEGATFLDEEGTPLSTIMRRLHAARAESLRGLTLRDLATPPRSRNDGWDLPA
ncbi:MAG: YhjD/YihY/BrkB family envelope integrity protein [Halothiobacillaceae bacterium]